MSTYVMSDIHGCFNDMMEMLTKIDFKEDDQLILAGDYIDRGSQNIQMLDFILDHPDNMLLLCGNHEAEFVSYVHTLMLMSGMLSEELEKLKENPANYLKVLYQVTKSYLTKEDNRQDELFDYYGTIHNLIEEKHITYDDLMEWAEAIKEMPDHYMLRINGRKCVVVHAGYIEELDGIQTQDYFESTKDFALYAREDAYKKGGIEHGMIIAGHTPTIAKGTFSYNEGKVFRYYDKSKDCIFYNIDCGCSYREKRKNARLACIRLEDEKIFYTGGNHAVL